MKLGSSYNQTLEKIKTKLVLKFTPNLFHQSISLWVMLFQFSPHEWVKVIYANIGFSHFGKKFLMIGASIMLGLSSPE